MVNCPFLDILFLQMDSFPLGCVQPVSSTVTPSGNTRGPRRHNSSVRFDDSDVQ